MKLKVTITFLVLVAIDSLVTLKLAQVDKTTQSNRAIIKDRSF